MNIEKLYTITDKINERFAGLFRGEEIDLIDYANKVENSKYGGNLYFYTFANIFNIDIIEKINEDGVIFTFHPTSDGKTLAKLVGAFEKNVFFSSFIAMSPEMENGHSFELRDNLFLSLSLMAKHDEKRNVALEYRNKYKDYLYNINKFEEKKPFGFGGK